MVKADVVQDNCTPGGLEGLTGALNHLCLKDLNQSVEQESSRSSNDESSDNEVQECLQLLELAEKHEDTYEKLKNVNELTKSDHGNSKPIITVTDSDVQNGNDLCKTPLLYEGEDCKEDSENDPDKKEKNDEAYESDEDNENVTSISASQDGTPPEEPEDPQEDAKDNMLTRGPCKGSRSHYVAHRYNPLGGATHHTGGSETGALPLLLGADCTFYQPLTPPYCHNMSEKDEVLYDPPAPSPYPHHHQHHHHMQQQMSPIPETLQHEMSPAYSTLSGYSPEYTSSAGNYGGCDYSPAPFDLGYLSPEYGGSSSNSSSPAGLAFDVGEDSLLSPNYLAALEDAVARTVSASSNPSSEDESDGSNSCVRFIMDSLRCIDKAELDYIAPPSPGPQTDLEQELALSVEPLDDYALNPSPPLSPFSPSLTATPLSPDFFAVESGPPAFTQELKEQCRSAVATVREMCHADVIMHAAKRVANQRTADLCNKDTDGDTCFLIVVCKPSDSPKFYENVFVLQQHLQKLRMCCDVPLEAGNKCCPLCGGSPSAWRSPLSETNNAGDSAVSCAVKMHHPAEVVHYLCAGLLLSGCAEDWRRVFAGQGRALLAPYVGLYPLLSGFL